MGDAQIGQRCLGRLDQRAYRGVRQPPTDAENNQYHRCNRHKPPLAPPACSSSGRRSVPSEFDRLGCGRTRVETQHEGFDRPGDVLQRQRPERLECQVQLLADMVAHRARDAHSADRTHRLKPGRHVDPVAVNIGALGEHVADVDPDPKADALAGRQIAVELRHPALHLCEALDCRGDAGELDQQGIPGGVHESADVLVQFGIDQLAADRPQAIARARIVTANMPAVPRDIGVDDGNQPAGARGFRGEVGLACRFHRPDVLFAPAPRCKEHTGSAIQSGW